MISISYFYDKFLSNRQFDFRERLSIKLARHLWRISINFRIKKLFGFTHMRHCRMAFGIIAHVQKKSKGLKENEYMK